MISCTEFIPLYSEFFKYLEKIEGPDAVMEYWIHISDTSIGDKTNPNSLAYKCEKLGGFEGAKAYWGHTLTEEACDLFQVNDNDKKVKYGHMRHCPSRGMLNALKHVEPYHNYCEHCNVIYQRVLKNYGIRYDRDTAEIENAACRSILYEVGNEPSFDWRNISDADAKKMFEGKENIDIIDMKSEDNKYLHRDFHLLGDNALKYCKDKYGYETMIDFLKNYVKFYYAPKIEKIRKGGLSVLKEWIEGVYEIEESSELLHCTLDGDTLIVKVDKSPVIEYMHTLGKEPSECYIEETRTLYKAIADECGYDFELKYYNEDGGTEFVFTERK